jgi:hypothetical protein
LCLNKDTNVEDFIITAEERETRAGGQKGDFVGLNFISPLSEVAVLNYRQMSIKAAIFLFDRLLEFWELHPNLFLTIAILQILGFPDALQNRSYHLQSLALFRWKGFENDFWVPIPLPDKLPLQTPPPLPNTRTTRTIIIHNLPPHHFQLDLILHPSEPSHFQMID